MKRFVVGIDFSPESELALWQAVDLAKVVGAQLVLVHNAVAPELGFGLEDTLAESGFEKEALSSSELEAARAKLAELEAAVRQRGVEVSSQVRDGFPDTGIGDLAKEIGADLVVVGTHGRTGIKRFLLGSVAERVVRLSPKSVLVVRREALHGFSRILVPTDFSDLSEAALATALELCPPRAYVDVVHAWQLPAQVTAYAPLRIADAAFGGLRDRIRDEVTEQGNRLIAQLGKPGVSLRFFALEGPPAATILAHLGDRRYDLVVMGARGRRGLRRLLLGSVSERVIRHAPCSVLAVHPPVQDAGG